VLQAVPLKEHSAGFDVYFLGNAIPYPAVLGAADRGEIYSCRCLGSQERGVLRAD
jgi:hypothetical protein